MKGTKVLPPLCQEASLGCLLLHATSLMVAELLDFSVLLEAFNELDQLNAPKTGQ
jgi:hypothetical protein